MPLWKQAYETSSREENIVSVSQKCEKGELEERRALEEIASQLKETSGNHFALTCGAVTKLAGRRGGSPDDSIPWLGFGG